MGDSCYMTLTIGGDIDTVEKLDTVIAALEADCAADNTNGQTRAVRACLVAALAQGYAPDFSFKEVKYANLACFDTLSELGLDLAAHNDAGGGYSAGMQTYDGVAGQKYEWMEEEENVVSMIFLNAVFAEPISPDEMIEKIKAKITEINDEQWDDLRPFTVSGEAADALAAEVARYKIEKAA